MNSLARQLLIDVITPGKGTAMPWINGRFFANPLFGRALERARVADSGRNWSEQYPESGFQHIADQNPGTAAPGQKSSAQPQDPSQAKPQRPSDHWVTIKGRRVLIHEPQNKASGSRLSNRDKSYLDKYFDAVDKLARKYDVDPTLILGLGIESGFASQGTYLRTGDAFGMTGGNTKHMTTAASPDENVRQFFDKYGDQIRGSGSNTSAFINGLEGRDASGRPANDRKVCNSVNPDWPADVRNGVGQMKRSVPVYVSQRNSQKVTK
jgi:hypothetical protein